MQGEQSLRRAALGQIDRGREPDGPDDDRVAGVSTYREENHGDRADPDDCEP